MRHFETIIVGGGPAGSTCAWHLRRCGRDVALLDKAVFPRTKLCGGWVTRKVLRDLEFESAAYPHPILELDVRSHIRGIPFGLKTGKPGSNYSIRRTEFDAFLLHRSGARVVNHAVNSVRRNGDLYVLDEQYSCDHLVGAGGTTCPVRRAIFPEKRSRSKLVATLEKEFEYPDRENVCRLHFFQRGLKGYAWFVPKGDDFVNIGLGGASIYFKRSGTSIHDHFRHFLDDLVAEGGLDAATAQSVRATGHPYYLYDEAGPVKKERCFLIGDAAGLASVDLAEGIGPAVESGLLAAGEILGEAEYRKEAITHFSSTGLSRKLLKWLLEP